MCPVVLASPTLLPPCPSTSAINGAFAFYFYFHLSVRSFVEFFLLLFPLLLLLLLSVEISCLTLFHFSTASDTCLPPHTHAHTRTPLPSLLVGMHKYLRLLLSYQIIYGAKGADHVGVAGEYSRGNSRSRGAGLGSRGRGSSLASHYSCYLHVVEKYQFAHLR